MKIEVPVELHRLFIDGINEDGTSPELSSRTHITLQRVDEQVTADMVPPFHPVDSGTTQYHNRHRVGHSPPPRGLHNTHGWRVVTDEAAPPSNHVGSCSARGLGHSRAVIEPTVELDDARVGIGLGSLA